MILSRLYIRNEKPHITVHDELTLFLQLVVKIPKISKGAPKPKVVRRKEAVVN